MSGRSLDAYVNGFVMGPKAGVVKMKFFGEDVNGFSREQLLAVVDWMADELEYQYKENEILEKDRFLYRSGFRE